MSHCRSETYWIIRGWHISGLDSFLLTIQASGRYSTPVQFRVFTFSKDDMTLIYVFRRRVLAVAILQGENKCEKDVLTLESPEGDVGRTLSSDRGRICWLLIRLLHLPEAVLCLLLTKNKMWRLVATIPEPKQGSGQMTNQRHSKPCKSPSNEACILTSSAGFLEWLSPRRENVI